MSTRKQRAASRANAQKSTGPRTEAGKAASRFNALKHGIDAKQQVTATESAEDLAELAAEYHERHAPSNPDERFLVDTLVNNEWRLRRLRRVEADLWRSNPDNAQAPSASGALSVSGPVFDRLQRIINSCERNFHRARKELLRIAAARQAEQAEQSKATSAPLASLRTNPETAAPAPPSPPYVPLYTADEMLEREKVLWQKLNAT